MNTSSSSEMATIIPARSSRLVDAFDNIETITSMTNSNIIGGSLSEYFTLTNILIAVGAVLVIYLLYCFIQKYNKNNNIKEDSRSRKYISEDPRPTKEQENNVMYERRVRFADQ